MSQPSYEQVATALDAVEAEMKKIGWWEQNPPTVDPRTFKQAFGMDQLAYSQWLQIVFIPNVRKIIQAKGKFPNRSMVAAQAVREFDGQTEASHLCTLLATFDALFN